jgi:hypothetical protein|tara:strand:+ start:21 stop:587 length:567 start_codon:yes stop_codon:yes gene_type:complete
MNVINIIRSVILSTIGIAGFAVLSIILIGALFSGPDPDSMLTTTFEKLVAVGELAELGYTFADVAEDMFIMVAWLNVWLLASTIIFAFGWSAGSHFLNVDAPGKAKLYAIHWFVVSASFIALVIITNWFILHSTTFPAAQDITRTGFFTLTFYTTTFYTLAYYISVLLGTARFVRSSVLLANKLPGNI